MITITTTVMTTITIVRVTMEMIILKLIRILNFQLNRRTRN